MDMKELSAALKIHPWQLEIRVSELQWRTQGSGGWPSGSHHFQVAIYRVGMGPGAAPAHCFEYSKGPAHKKSVWTAELVCSLLQDARIPGEYADEWEMAYNLDMDISTKDAYLKAANMYHECEKVADWFWRVFTPKEIEELYKLFEDF